MLSRKIKLTLSVLTMTALLLFAGQLVLAETAPSSGNYGLEKTATEGFGQNLKDNNASLPLIIGRVIGAGLAFLGVVFFTLILYGGLTWILSMGKEDKINQAKELITAAVLGLIVVLGAYAITNLTAKIFSDTIPPTAQTATS